MDSKQTMILVFTMLGVFIAMALAAYYSGGAGPRDESLHTTKRFTARPGTERKNAVALSSNKRPEQKPSAAALPTGDPLPIKSISPRDEKKQMTVDQALVAEALNSLDPDTGIEKLNEALATPQSPEASSRMLAGRAELALQRRPPDYAAAEADLRMAVATAPTLALRQELLAEEARLWLRQGKPEAALEALDAALEQPGPLTMERVQMRGVLAQAHEQANDASGAEKQYRQVLREALELDSSEDPEVVDLMRLSALRLSQILRDSDRAEEANDLARLLADHFRDE